MQTQLPSWLFEASARLLEGVSGKALSADYLRLSAGYRGGKPAEAKGLWLAYLAGRMPGTYAAVAAALRRLPEDLAASCLSTLDLGSGPGTASWAALEMLPRLEQVTALEQDSQAMELAEALAEDARLKPKFSKQDLSAGSIQAEAGDLVLAAYVANELESEKRENFFRAAWSKTQKALVLVEPGTPPGFEALLQARQLLLAEGACLLAPCPGDGLCPLASKPAEKWCHFSQRFERSRLAKLAKPSELGYEDEKYSYLIFARQAWPRPEARLIGHPKKGQGFIHLELCGQGGLEQRRYSKRDGDSYKKAKKLEWGDDVQG
jgi:ribosomal protein RSM22 (predicted rRNA methylase)